MMGIAALHPSYGTEAAALQATYEKSRAKHAKGAKVAITACLIAARRVIAAKFGECADNTSTFGGAK